MPRLVSDTKKRVSLLALFPCRGSLLLHSEPWRAGGVGWWGAGSPRPAPLQLSQSPETIQHSPAPGPHPKPSHSSLRSDRVRNVRDVSWTPMVLGRSGQVSHTQLFGP